MREEEGEFKHGEAGKKLGFALEALAKFRPRFFLNSVSGL
jgi:hypothetical protein